MQFRILGPLEVLDGQRPVELGRPKQRAVLAVLLVHANQVVTLDRLTHRLAFVSLSLVAAIALTACQRGSDTADPQRSPAQPASRPAPTPTTATRGSDFGFIRSWYAKTGTLYLRFDRAILLTGKAADTASAAHGGESPVPNDFYIQNDNPRLRDLVILDQATVVGSQQLTGNPGSNPSNLKSLLNFVHEGGPQVAATPFHLRYDANGHVIRVQEQYLP